MAVQAQGTTEKSQPFSAELSQSPRTPFNIMTGLYQGLLRSESETMEISGLTVSDTYTTDDEAGEYLNMIELTAFDSSHTAIYFSLNRTPINAEEDQQYFEITGKALLGPLDESFVTVSTDMHGRRMEVVFQLEEDNEIKEQTEVSQLKETYTVWERDEYDHPVRVDLDEDTERLISDIANQKDMMIGEALRKYPAPTYPLPDETIRQFS